MGYGSWTTSAYANYTYNTTGMSVEDFATTNFSARQLYTSRKLNEVLNPYKVMRECCDSEEHPNTLPVILALDVTGSMGDASVKVAQKLNEIMTELYADENVKDIEFCIMGIGDLSYDDAPIQMSQFESDIRIAEQLDKIYFEAGGGGNKYESYTAAWYMGTRHAKLDCWKRGQKGIIITLGDELPNPYLPKDELVNVTGDSLQNNIETSDLYKEVIEKYDVYHIAVNDTSSSYGFHNFKGNLDTEWKKLIGENNYFVANLNNLSKIITDIISSRATNINTIPSLNTGLTLNEDGEVTW